MATHMSQDVAHPKSLTAADARSREDKLTALRLLIAESLDQERCGEVTVFDIEDIISRAEKRYTIMT